MIVVITSPDSLSIGMFTDFLRKYFLPSSLLINLNGLLSGEILDKVVEETFKRHPAGDIIFRHKTRGKLQPMKLPQALVNKADSIVGFDLYSTHVEVIKSSFEWTDPVVSAWVTYVEKLNTTNR